MGRGRRRDRRFCMIMSLKGIYDRSFDEDTSVDEKGQSHAGCPECGGIVRTNSIETTCEDCGLVIDDRPINHGPEWRSFDGAEQRTRERTGTPLTPTRHDRGLSSEIGYNVDGKGNTLSGQKRRHLARLRREHKRGQWTTRAEQNLAHGLGEAQRVASALDLSKSLREQACRLYRTATHEDLIRGRSIEAMATASVYAACRCNSLPRTLTEVVEVARVPREDVERAYTVLNRDLKLPTVPMEPAEYIPRIVSALDLSPAVQQRAIKFAKAMTAAGATSGCKPMGAAAACIYQVTQERSGRITQEALAEAADVSAVTVRARWNQLKTVLADADGQSPGEYA